MSNRNAPIMAIAKAGKKDNKIIQDKHNEGNISNISDEFSFDNNANNHNNNIYDFDITITFSNSISRISDTSLISNKDKEINNKIETINNNPIKKDDSLSIIIEGEENSPFSNGI